jgi:hypothetical protein
MNRRFKATLLIVLVAVLVNLPLAHSTWTAWRVDRSGVDVVGTVTDTSRTGDAFFVEFRMPAGSDPDQRLWSAQVDEATYDEALAGERVEVRVLPGEPAAYRVEGAVTSRIWLVIAVLVDLLLVLAAVLVWRPGSRGRAELVLRATEGVRRCRPGAVLERLADGQHVVAGEVCAIEPGEIVLDLGDRRVRVLLDGHDNQVGYQQPAQVTGRLVR